MPRYVVPKAKNAANRPLLEALAEKRSKIDPNRNKFAFTLKNAMDNLAKHGEPVSCYKDACAVRGIGQKIANMLFPSHNSPPRSLSDSQATNAALSSIFPAGVAATSSALKDSSPQSSVASTVSSVGSSQEGGRGRSNTGTIAAVGTAVRSRKQIAYDRELERATQQFWKGLNLQWNVVFLVDDREKRDGRDRLCDKFSSANIPFEVRHLPIGDVTWVAQGRQKRNRHKKGGSPGLPPRPPAGSKGDGDVVVELVLGTIIERKTLDDLHSSINGTRYAEQRMRLQNSGLSQRVLLVEGNLHRDATLSEANSRFLEKCHTAIWETCLYLGFQAIRTSDMGETIAVLKLLHRRILQRSFPAAFYDETLPTFAEPSAAGEHRRDGRTANSSTTGTAGLSTPSVREQQARVVLGQRKRRRHQSLHKMVFDIDPTPPRGMDRFVTYKELKAKVECDRESGLRTARMLHAAMLKQVPKIENKKAATIVGAYPTPTQLFAAYHRESTEQEKELMLRDLDTTAAENYTRRPSQRKCTVGLESSRQVYVAYAMSREASERPTFADQFRKVQQEQRDKRWSLSSQSSSGDNDESSSLLLSQSSSVATTTTSSRARVAAGSSTTGPTSARLLRGGSHSMPSSAIFHPKPPPIPPPAAAPRSRGGSPGSASLSSYTSSQPSKKPLPAALASKPTRRKVTSSSRQANKSSNCDDGVIDLCGDSSDEEDSNVGDGDDDDDDYSPVRKPSAGSASAAAAATAAAPVAAAAAAPIESSSRKNQPRLSIGSVSSSSCSSSWMNHAPAARRKGIGLANGGEDEDDDNPNLVRAPAVVKKPMTTTAKAPAAESTTAVPARKPQPEVYELLSD
jgi:ERCC4-type nuclease